MYQGLVPPVAPVYLFLFQLLLIVRRQECHHVDMVLGFGKVLLSRLYSFVSDGRFGKSEEILKWCEGYDGEKIRKGR